MRSRDFARRLALLAVLVGSTFLGACTSESDSSNVGGNSSFLLSFTTEPTNSITGGALAPVAVTLADPFGNVLTTTNTPVTISLENASNASLSGTLTVTPVNGVATFSDLLITGTGSNLNFQASAPGFATTSSVAFVVSTGTPSQLGFLVPPSNADLGSVISPSIQVAVQDAVGSTISSSTSIVTLSLLNNPGNATLNGTLSVPAVNGVADFTDISLDATGTGFTLTASTAGLTSATSAGFDIAAGPIAAINIQTQPSDGTVNLAVNPSIEVALVDAGNNVVTSGAAPITLALGSNTGRARLLGTTTVIANNGVATFNDIRLSEAGTSFTLIASTAIVQTAVTSATFDIVKDNPNIVSVTTASGDLGGCVPISYAVAQAASENVDILVEYDPDGTGAFFPATQAAMTGSSSQGVSGVNSAPGPNGASSVFLWNSSRDLPLASASSVQIRVTASLRGDAGSSMTLSNLSVQNNASLTAGAVLATATGPNSIAIADMNKDGFLDFVVVDDAASNVAVYRQDPANPGTFLGAVNVSVGSNPRSVAVGDFNKDGRLDLAVANFGDDTLSIRLQNSGTNFSFASSADLTADSNPRFVLVDDFDKDGVLDIAVANESSVLTLHFGLPVSPGSFSAAAQLDADSAPVALASGDINNDGFVDLLVANRDSDNLSVLLQNSS
ncbi:MAG: VCBS repeat-containing protein, partial [Planctomycetota bacterium]|nr:VCBS repeat-containing protein [Planctomycetota bacterium]